MKRTRKGFTLVELLIVVAILGVLGSMMMMSSTDGVDAAGANAILSNLDSMKTAAMAMYMGDVTAASKASIALDESDILPKLAAYLGKASNAITLGKGAGKYGLIGGDAWYVVYQFSPSDTAGVKKKLADKAKAVDLFGQEDEPKTSKTVTDTPATYNDDGSEKTAAVTHQEGQLNCGFSDYYANGDEVYIALRVR